VKWFALLLLALSSCTFAQAITRRRDTAPTVSLSPSMQKLDDRQHASPSWAFVGDSLLMVGGFMAGPLADGRVDESLVQPLNVGGFVVTGIMFASLGYTAYRWGL
jgi:hypothetical protein